MIDEDEAVAVANAARRSQLPPPFDPMRRQTLLDSFAIALPHDTLIVRRFGRLDRNRMRLAAMQKARKNVFAFLGR